MMKQAEHILSVGKQEASLSFLSKGLLFLMRQKNVLLRAGSAALPFYCAELYGNFCHAVCRAPFLSPCHNVKAVFQDKRGFKRSYWF